jgi:nitrilase
LLATVQLVALPEYFGIMGMTDTDKVAARERDGVGPMQDVLSGEARRHKVWIVGGSVPLESADPDRVRNSCLVYDDRGLLKAR